VDKAQAAQLKTELIITLVTTLLFLAMYWWATLPEWKREALIIQLRSMVKVKRRGGLSLVDRLEIEKFRAEISRWEHARKRDK